MKPILKISIKAEKDTYKVGEKITLLREIVNLSKKDAYLDQDSLNMGFEFKDQKGERIPGWPYTDRLEKPGGAEVFLKIDANEPFISDLSITVADQKWIGFGVEDGEYTGTAFQVFRTAGESIYKIDEIPGTYSIRLFWSTNDNCKERAKKYGFKNVFQGQLESNEVKIRIVR